LMLHIVVSPIAVGSVSLLMVAIACQAFVKVSDDAAAFTAEAAGAPPMDAVITNISTGMAKQMPVII